jgi:hypothetical protein
MKVANELKACGYNMHERAAIPMSEEGLRKKIRADGACVAGVQINTERVLAALECDLSTLSKNFHDTALRMSNSKAWESGRQEMNLEDVASPAAFYCV